MKKNQEGGSICGGIVSDSIFNSNPWAYMMAYRLPDKQYEKYVAEKDETKRKKIFDKYATSAI